MSFQPCSKPEYLSAKFNILGRHDAGLPERVRRIADYNLDGVRALRLIGLVHQEGQRSGGFDAKISAVCNSVPALMRVAEKLSVEYLSESSQVFTGCDLR